MKTACQGCGRQGRYRGAIGDKDLWLCDRCLNYFNCQIQEVLKNLAKRTEKCAFDEGDECRALKIKDCPSCNFYMTEKEVAESQAKVDMRLKRLGSHDKREGDIKDKPKHKGRRKEKQQIV